MKLPLLLSSIALTLSGLALLSTLASKEDAEPTLTPTRNAADASDVNGEIAAIREALERLSARLDVMESMPAALTPVPDRLPLGDLAKQADLDELRADLLAELKGADSEQSGLAKEPGRLQQDVAIALDEVRRAERETARQKKNASAITALEESLPIYQEKLGLTATQTDGLRTVLEGRQARWDEMGRLWEAGDRQAVGTMKEEEREVFNTELGGVLNEQQVEQFRNMNGRRGGK